MREERKVEKGREEGREGGEGLEGLDISWGEGGDADGDFGGFVVL